MAELEVLICTLDNGIDNIIEHILPPIEHVSYLVSWQITGCYSPSDVTKLSTREDVRVFSYQTKGLSANRNNALSLARGDILLFADDDNVYTREGLLGIIRAFERYHDRDILTFRMLDEYGRFIKSYSSFSFDYECQPAGTYFSSCEIAIRNRVKQIKFDTRFGLGADYLCCGEEEVYLFDAYRSGAKISFVPFTIGSTIGKTTGSLFDSNVKVRRSKGAVLCIIHGALGAFIRCLKYSLFNTGSKKVQFLKDMYDGIRYINKH